MFKKLLILPVIIISLASCNKSVKNSGCDANRLCTTEFASINLQFEDASGAVVDVKDITVINLRTNSIITAKNVIDPGFSPNNYTIATDSNKDEFSVKGDDVRVTATSMATNQTVSALFKISGGCNCHIAKLSGPAKLIFN